MLVVDMKSYRRTMPLHDFECQDCPHRALNLYFEPRKVPRRKKCPDCGKWMRQVWDGDRDDKAQIHPSVASMYGRFHPGFGCVVKDYAHKKRLERKYNVREAHDSVGGESAIDHDRRLAEEEEKRPTFEEMTEFERSQGFSGGWVDEPHRLHETTIDEDETHPHLSQEEAARRLRR